jgi:hypothetical protein
VPFMRIALQLWNGMFNWRSESAANAIKINIYMFLHSYDKDTLNTCRIFSVWKSSRMIIRRYQNWNKSNIFKRKYSENFYLAPAWLEIITFLNDFNSTIQLNSRKSHNKQCQWMVSINCTSYVGSQWISYGWWQPIRARDHSMARDSSI